MKRLVSVLVLSMIYISLLASVKNGVTRVHEGNLKFQWTIPYLEQNGYNGYKPGYIATIGLDYYEAGDCQQYAFILKFAHTFIQYPGILPMGGSLVFETEDNNTISLDAFLVHVDSERIMLQTATCGYYPVSEEQLQTLCAGVKRFGFDYEFFDGNEVVKKRSSLSGKLISHELRGFYKKVSKEASKIKHTTDESSFFKFSTDAIARYHDYNDHDFLYGQYREFIGEEQASQSSWDAYTINKEEFQTVYNSIMMSKIAEKVEKQSKSMIGVMSAAGTAVLEAINNDAQRKSAAIAAKREQQELQMEALTQRIYQTTAAKQQQEMNRTAAASQNYYVQQPQASGSRSMETSDMNQYMATRMSDATYGNAATDQALAQQRQYDAEQNQQYRINEQRRIDQQLGVTENAVTSSGEHIQIRVNNGVVTAYSTSQNNFSGTGPDWETVINAAITRTTDNRYGYESNVGGGIGKVYWGEHSPTIQNNENIGGTPVNAVTANGETIQIRVSNKDTIIAYRKSGSLPWNNRIVTAKKTNVTYDGEQIASRFQYKADLPDIGTVYF